MSRRPIIAGNWKMFKTTGEARAFAEALADKLKNTAPGSLPEIVVCPPFTALSTVLETLGGNKLIRVAAQTMESRDNGAYTGEISPVMLVDLGVNTVVIGHSERREYYNETDETVNAKTVAALKHGMTPIVCVGETLKQREAGETDAHIKRQVEKAVAGISAADSSKLVFAYEPVWAIGTGKTCESPEANRVCGLIRETLAKFGDSKAIRILYGGSVKPDNAQELLAKSDIDGALVGGASLEPESFYKIIAAAIGTEAVTA